MRMSQTDNIKMCSTNFFIIAVFCVLPMALGKPTDVEQEKIDQTYVPMCKSKKHEINPDELIRKWLPDENWEFDENFSQRIEGEVCENVGSSCNDFPFTKTRCIQRYLQIKLQVVSKDRKSEIKGFSIPSHCECAFLRRRNGDNSNSSQIGWRRLSVIKINFSLKLSI